MTVAEAARIVRHLEAECRGEHKPCNALGDVELTTKK